MRTSCLSFSTFSSTAPGLCPIVSLPHGVLLWGVADHDDSMATTVLAVRTSYHALCCLKNPISAFGSFRCYLFRINFVPKMHRERISPWFGWEAVLSFYKQCLWRLTVSCFSLSDSSLQLSLRSLRSVTLSRRAGKILRCKKNNNWKITSDFPRLPRTVSQKKNSFNHVTAAACKFLWRNNGRF